MKYRGIYMPRCLKGETMLKKEESGSVMLEAVIYFPIVILLVALIICVSVAKLEEEVLDFATKKVATQTVRSVAYKGYDDLYGGDKKSMRADFGKLPSEDSVNNYYSDQAMDLYDWGFNNGEYETNAKKDLKNIVSTFYIVGAGPMTPVCTVDVKGGLVPSVETKVIYKVDLPKMFGFLVKDGDSPDMLDSLAISSRNRKVAINTTEFVRNVDMAADICTYLGKQLGISDSIGSFMDKIKTVKDKII